MYVCTCKAQKQTKSSTCFTKSPVRDVRENLAEKMAARHPEGKKDVKGVLFTLRISRGHFFLEGFHSHV